MLPLLIQVPQTAKAEELQHVGFVWLSSTLQIQPRSLALSARYHGSSFAPGTKLGPNTASLLPLPASSPCCPAPCHFPLPLCSLVSMSLQTPAPSAAVLWDGLRDAAVQDKQPFALPYMKFPYNYSTIGLEGTSQPLLWAGCPRQLRLLRYSGHPWLSRQQCQSLITLRPP